MTDSLITEQWTEQQVREAFAAGQVEAISQALKAGQLNEVLNPQQGA